MSNAVWLEAYRRSIEELVKPCIPRLEQMKVEFEQPDSWPEMISHGGDQIPAIVRCPVQRFDYRIKGPTSTLRKIALTKDAAALIDDDGYLVLNDLLGCRIVTYTSALFRLIHERLTSYEHLQLVQGKAAKMYDVHDVAVALGPGAVLDAGIKASGYRSVHYPVQWRQVGEEVRPFEFEIQLRTILSDAWGEIDHKLGYKPGGEMEHGVNRQLRVMAGHLVALDEHVNLIYERLYFLRTRQEIAETRMLDDSAVVRLCEDYELPCSESDALAIAGVCAAGGLHTVGEFRKFAPREFVTDLRLARAQKLGTPSIGADEFFRAVILRKNGLQLERIIDAISEQG